MPRVPYARLRAAERDAEKQYPNADRVRAGWSPGSEFEVYVEVWTDGSASVVPA